MKRLVKSTSLLLIVFFVLGAVLILEAGSDEGSSSSSSNFQAFHTPFVRCGDTTTLCGLESDSPLLGADPLLITQGSRARLKKFGDLVVRVDGAEPDKTYDVLLVHTPGGSVDCSSFDPSTCTADCTDPDNPVITCDFEPANCSTDCTDPDNPVISCCLDPANCTAALSLVLVGSFTTDSSGKGSLTTDISSHLSSHDSVHVLVTDHDADPTTLGDAPRQFITGAKVRD